MQTIRNTAFQDDLFSGSRWVERTTALGVTVRVQLQPLGRGQVRVLRYERRRPSERAFTRRPEEEGRVQPLAAIAPDQDYARLFGTPGGATTADRSRR